MVESVIARPHQPACRAGALLVCHDPEKFTIYDFGFMIWQAAVVLPHARQVLGTRLRKLARGLWESVNRNSQIVNGLVRLVEQRPGDRAQAPVKLQPRN